VIAHRAWHWIAAIIALLVIAALAVCFGAVSLPLGTVVRALTGRATPDVTTIVLTLRLPRVALAALVGIGLGASGATLQATLRNPLAEPYLLGVSGGAAVGAVFGMIAGISSALWPLLGFLGAAVAVALALGVARGAAGSGADVRVLLMAGVVVGALANAIIMVVLANVPPGTVRGALWWMMGSVADATWRPVLWLTLYVALGLGYLVRLAPQVDVLTLGEDAAAGLGVSVARATQRAFLASALLAATTVAAAGLVGFVGLIVPYVVRAGGITRHRGVIAGSALLGALLVILADLVARVAIAPTELPLGAITAILGVPFFLVQLRRLA
jgi:iron complex transport system permease protein